MSSIASIKKQMARFGLSEKQSEIYLVLVKQGELRIQEIVNLTETPRSSVYEAIKALDELGLVEEVVEDNFKRIKAYPISSMRHNLNEQILELQSLSSDLDTIENSLASLPATDKLASTKVRYYKGVAGARQLFWNTLKSQETIRVYSEYGRSKYVGKKFYADFVEESKSRKIKENVLINPTNRAISLIEKDSSTTLARTNKESIRQIAEAKVKVRGETFIYDHVFAQVYLDGLEINGFEIESPNFVEFQRSVFDNLWEQAEKLN